MSEFREPKHLPGKNPLAWRSRIDNKRKRWALLAISWPVSIAVALMLQFLEVPGADALMSLVVLVPVAVIVVGGIFQEFFRR